MMKTGRDKKIAEEFRREISSILCFEMNDPRLYGITVTTVRVTPDLSLARVYFAIPGQAERAQEVQKALKKSSAYIRRLVASRIRMRYLPQLEFFYDESLDIEERMNEIFAKLPPYGEEGAS